MLDMNVFIKIKLRAVTYFKAYVLYSMARLVPFKGDVPVELGKKSIELTVTAAPRLYFGDASFQRSELQLVR